MLAGQAFQRCAPYHFRLIQGSQGPQASEHTYVEVIELDFYQKLLAADKTRGLKKMEARQFEVLKTWHQIAIRELINLGSFKPNPERITRTLLPAIEPQEARDSLKALLESGLIRRTANGYRAENDAITTDDETMALFVRNYHQEMLELAKRALDAVSPEQRDISSVYMAIREAGFPKLKKQIQLMRKELRVFAALALAALAGSGCFTEIGNPGKEQTVSARFRIDYSPAPDSLRIRLFYFNVVEVNYTALDGAKGRIWKVPDSLGQPVDFTGADTEAVLPPVAVPPASYSILKLECRIPAHAILDPDTVAFARFGGRGYIKGIAYYPERAIRFICQLPDDYKINLVYTQDTLEQWRHGDTYTFDFVFYATRWLSAADLTGLAPAP